MTECDNATRSHAHVNKCGECGRPRINTMVREAIWITIHDDGSICTRDVIPTPPKYSPEQVLAGFIGQRAVTNRDETNQGKAHRT